MADMVKVPGIGPVKKPWLYAGIALTAGILAFAYYRRSQQPAETTVPATADAATTDYAQSSDAAGYNTVEPSIYSGNYSPYGYDLYGNPLPPPTGASGSGGAYQTNADWASAAQAALERAGVTEQVSGMAISRVLGGLTVTSDQQGLFLQSVGLLGQPPQGYPQPIRLSDTPAQPGPPAPAPVTSLPAPKGLKVTHADRSYVDIDWDPVAKATGYKIYVNGASKTSSLYTTHRVSRLNSNTAYKIGVAAVAVDPAGPGSADVTGPQATVQTRTKK